MFAGKQNILMHRIIFGSVRFRHSCVCFYPLTSQSQTRFQFHGDYGAVGRCIYFEIPNEDAPAPVQCVASQCGVARNLVVLVSPLQEVAFQLLPCRSVLGQEN
jgi:hypothetical protein